MRHARLKVFVTRISILSAALLLISACGSNGEIVTWDDKEQVKPPAETPIQQGNPPPTSITPPECQDCTDVACCDDCDEGEGEDDNTDSTPNHTLPELYVDPPSVEDIRVIPFFPIPNIETEKKESPRICMHPEDPASHWWLIYQLRGGLLKEMNGLKLDSHEMTEDGMLIHFIAESYGGKTMMELDLLLGELRTDENTTYVDPYDFTFRFDTLPFADPVIGPTKITGNVKCTGQTYTNSEDNGTWSGTFICNTTPDKILLSTENKDYVIGFSSAITFDNNGKRPKDFRIYNSRFELNDIIYMVNSGYPEELDICFPAGRN